MDPIAKTAQEESARILELVGQYFEDNQKAKLWFESENPALGDISPRDMIRYGRYDKLLGFVVTALNDKNDQNGHTS